MWMTRMFKLSPDGDEGDFGIQAQMQDQAVLAQHHYASRAGRGIDTD